MPIDLHPNCRARLVELVGAALPHLRVHNGKFLLRSAGKGRELLYRADEALPQKGPVYDSLLSYIDEQPLSEFIHDKLTDELRDAEYSEIEGQTLCEIDGFRDAAAVATRLIEEFVALPQEYRLTFPLPYDLWPALPPSKSRRDLSPRVRTVRTNPELVNELPLVPNQERTPLVNGLLGLLSSDYGGAWKENAVHLQVDVQGFIGGYGGSSPDAEAQRTLRAFYGLGLALRLFDRSTKYSMATPRWSYFVHRRTSEATYEPQRRLELDENLSRAMERLGMHTLGGWVNSPERQASWSEGILGQMASVFSMGVKSESILLASQWYFDSVTGPDYLLQYVQAMVVLEILLGDKAATKDISLNELLRNRCAYLIGSSQEERAELHKRFTEIYDVRSQIVHRGKHRLSGKEQWMLSQLRSICRRVIQKEVSLLVANRVSGVV